VHLDQLRSAGLCLVVVLAGCATTGGGGRAPAGPVPRVAAACKPRSLEISPAARAPGEAGMIPVAKGYALTWGERIGERDALRFLVVDLKGNPLSPSAELTDRAARITAPSLAVDGEGYVVGWTEGATRLRRAIDGRGRPRTDVSEVAEQAKPSSASRCTSGPAGFTCQGGDERSLELPAQARPVAEALGAGALAVIAQDAEALRLWVLDCAAR